MKTRSARRRWHESRDVPERPASLWRSKRFVALFAAFVALAGLLTVTQVSAAQTRRRQPTRPVCTAPPTAKVPAPSSTVTGKPSASPSKSNPTGIDPAAGDVPNPGQTAGTVWGGNQNGRNVQNHVGDGQETGTSNFRRPGQCTPSSSTTTAAPAPSTSTSSAPLEILGNNCDKSRLQAHDGFQNGNRCVSTAFGEVSEQSKNPTLLIVRAPLRVRVGEAFTIQVATRNLVRDRFLAAGKGGYYLESSFLTADGLVRGHFHSACRMLSSTRSAPDPAPVPAFFVATEDGGGDGNSSTVTINVTGMPTAGIAQCASWAGDGSHRIPMMQRANQIPAFDSVRIFVTQ
jgi:hypothetical protein